MDALSIRTASPTDMGVAQLLAAHEAHSAAHYPTTSDHTLPTEVLAAQTSIALAAWLDAQCVGFGAFIPLGADELELKSFHVSQDVRGKGVGRVLLEALLFEARMAGAAGVRLETGMSPAYAVARRLYARAGFETCPPFDTYREDPMSVFMMLPL